MSANVSDFGWTARKEAAALEVARDLLPDTAIAAEIGITQRTLERWKRIDAFMARVEEHRAGWREQLRELGLADRQNRVAAKNDRWKLLQQVIDERATDPELQAVPGGRTGLLVHQLKQIGAGRDAKVVDEYAVDTGLLKEMRDLEKEAAQDLGQWVERREYQDEDLAFARQLARKLGASDEQAERIAARVAGAKR